MSHTLSTETIVTVVFGIVASLITIAGIIATVRATRNHRRGQGDIEGQDLAPLSTAVQQGQYFRLVRFTSLESLESDGNGRGSLPTSIRNTSAQQWHHSHPSV